MDNSDTSGMTQDEFALALRQGRGAAPIHVFNHGLEGIEGVVLQACLESQAYDAQDEGDRARWLYSMFANAPQYAFFQRHIIAALRDPSPDNSVDQLCHLAGLMAQAGDAAAGAALREFFWKQDQDHEGRLIGSQAIALLDGLPVVVEIARMNGRML